ncbi:MAG: hypothetical protein ABFC92_02740, partial [Rectinema sp.]
MNSVWGFCFLYPIGFFTSLDSGRTPSVRVEVGGLGSHAASARVKGTRKQTGLLNAWSPCREPDALGLATT